MSFNEYPYRNLTDLNLDYLLKKLKELESQIADLLEWKPEFIEMYNEVKAFIEQIEAGNLPPGMVNAIYNWMNENAIDLVGDMVKNVYFGLTNDGYFCAFIPASWNWVTFDTITDPDEALYGHLVLMYD
jgi:hypothetical protein